MSADSPSAFVVNEH